MEFEILKEALEVARVKKPSLPAIMERSEGRFAMQAVAETLAVARSNLIEPVSRRAYEAPDTPITDTRRLGAQAGQQTDARTAYQPPARAHA